MSDSVNVNDNDKVNSVDAVNKEAYKYGFTTAVEAITFGRGLNEDIVRAIAAARNEPQFMLDFRLRARERRHDFY